MSTAAARYYCPLCQLEGLDPEVEFCPNDGARFRPLSERGAEWVGKVLDGKYKMLRFLDAGGTAEVYEAERTSTSKRVAVKLLHAAHASKPGMMDSFLQEAQLVSRIAHPNIVAIQDFGTLQGAVHYMVMELLDGDTLAVEIARTPLPALTALKYAMQACEGLAAAHARDVVHCDIKPANMFLQRVPGSFDRIVKILDLGIGRLFAPGATAGLESPQIVAGTPEYMSPEQAKGERLSPASDVYSMGVAIYEMLLGEVPFSDASFVTVLKRHMHDAPPWPEELADERGVPPAARDVIWRAMAKNPADRYSSMLELQSHLASLARDAKSRSGALVSSSRITIPAPRSSDETPPAVVRTGEHSRMKSRPRLTPSERRVSKSLAARIVPLAESTGADDEVAELAPDVYWVGRRHGRLLECNAFLRVFRRGNTEISVLTDPGPPKDFDVVAQKVATVLGSIKRLDFIFLNHQDPDVASNAAPIQQRSPRTRIIASEDTFRLAHFYGLDESRFLATESLAGSRTKLATGHELWFVPTPFCHFRGAVMLYDPESRVLFSGDLFGGARANDLVASDKSFPGVEMFHQIYMPTKRALTMAVARTRALDPAPKIIAPQHGAFLTDDNVPRMLEWMNELEVGLDLLESPADESRFRAAANDLLLELVELAGEQRTRELLESFATDTSFSRVVVLDADRRVSEFKVAPHLALEALAADALAALPADQRGGLQRSIRTIWRQHSIDVGARVGGDKRNTR
jgi:serine/threonine-protein kinase